MKGRGRGGGKSHLNLTRVSWSECDLTETIHSPFLCCRRSYPLSLSSWGFLQYTQTAACRYTTCFQVCLLECYLKTSLAGFSTQEPNASLRATSTSWQGYPDTVLVVRQGWLCVTKMMACIIFKFCSTMCLFFDCMDSFASGFGTTQTSSKWEGSFSYR